MEFELQASVGHIDFPSSYPWPAEPKQAAGTPNPELELVSRAMLRNHAKEEEMARARRRAQQY